MYKVEMMKKSSNVFGFLVSWILPVCLHAAQTVYITHIRGMDTEKMFFDENSYRDQIAKPWCRMREALENAGYIVRFSLDGEDFHDFRAMISLNETNATLLANLAKFPKKRSLLFILEPPVVMPDLYRSVYTQSFGKIFVMFDDLIDQDHYFKFCYPQPRLHMVDHIANFKDKKFCALIASNNGSDHYKSLYRKRSEVIDFFENLGTDELDLYGPNWHGHPSWKGYVPSKWEVLKHYKFSFCYENMGGQIGYITEKIFDSLVAGCVPVYLGATNIAAYVPVNCFIDRRAFSSLGELYHYLKSMDESVYENYITAIRNYIEGPRVRRFSDDSFIKLVLDEIAKLD